MTDTVVYWDCNVCLGRPTAGVYRPCPTAEGLLAEMDWLGIERALLRHALMSDQSPAVGNRALFDAIAGQSRLMGSWAILPPQTGELGDPTDFFCVMAAANVRALWAFPEEHRYLLNRVTFGGFLDVVAERRFPLLLPRHAGGPRPPDTYALLTNLLAEYPTLTVVLMSHGSWGEDRFFRPLLDRYPGLHLDISRYELDGGLVELVERYGASRLLYGSNFPATTMGGPRLMLARAAISEADRAAIAGGNLKRLLEGVQR